MPDTTTTRAFRRKAERVFRDAAAVLYTEGIPLDEAVALVCETWGCAAQGVEPCWPSQPCAACAIREAAAYARMAQSDAARKLK